jgi:outer membrane protein TolC
MEASAAAAEPALLHSPLRLSDVTAISLQNRAEITAANARADALAQRPAIVSSPEDPMVSVSVDHYPFEAMMDGGRRYDRSISVEQKFPLSAILSHRRSAALADAERARALADVTELDVVLDAQRSFFMLLERRRMRPVVEEQISLANLLVDVAASRYASGTGAQADVLRAEAEVARLKSKRQSLEAQIRGAEAMLNAGLGRPVEAAVPDLHYLPRLAEPPSIPEVLELADEERPELDAGAAEVKRADAETRAMRSMYKPMATVRAGYAETMAEGPGAMLMVGISAPIWRRKLSSGVAEAQAMQRMADADLEAMRRMIAGETLAAREGVLAARTQVDLLRQDVLPRTQVAMDAALGGYASGQGSLTAVIEAARALWEAQGEQVMADSVLGEAWARLDRATGTNQEARP